MPQPTPFLRGFSFSDYQAGAPSSPLPGYRVDSEFDGIATTLAGVLGNLALIQRDDGKLADGCITVDSLSAELLAEITPADGVDGVSPPAPNFVMAAHTVAPGGEATVSVTGAYPNLNLDFGLPRGAPAAPGEATLPDADYGDVTISGSGTVMQVDTVKGGQDPATAADIAATNAAVAGKAPLAHTHTLADLVAILSADADAFDKLVYTDPSGFTTVGKAIDFHATDNDGTDYKVRLVANVDGSLTIIATGADENGTAISLVGHTHAIADVTGLQAALDAKQPAGSYASTAALATKADALTTILDFSVDVALVSGHNNRYVRFTGATPRTLTFGDLDDGMALIAVNRGTVNLTIACAGGYYKNGSAIATANLTLAPGGKLTAFHEGGGVWTFDGNGF